MKKVWIAAIAAALVVSLTAGLLIYGSVKNDPLPKMKQEVFDLGAVVTESDGNTDVTELKFESEKEMLEKMTLACQNGKYELYYSPDTMTVALKQTATGKVIFSNPYNAANDQNHSGVIGEKLDSQIVLTYLENETKPVELYSATECAAKGQYKITTYENALSFRLNFGEEQMGGNLLRVFTKGTYESIRDRLSEDDKELLEIYYTFYKESKLADSGIFEVYPKIKKQDLYYCNFEFSDRDKRKLTAVMEEAGFTAEDAKKETEKLSLGESTESNPYFQLTLNYILTEDGVTVNIPNNSISYNPDYPLLKIGVLPYFGADEASKKAKGYLLIPDGSGTMIRMDQQEENRRILMTGKVYGENASKLPKKIAEEKLEQYYLPVFGTVRNNKTALFGMITSGDANAGITAILGRPNGNYYTVYPEFILADYEPYTRVSVVENAWSNKNMYLYDKNTTQEDFNIQYRFLNGKEANYSAMARVYREYLFGQSEEKAQKAVLNLETVGSALTKKSFMGFSYDAEAVFTGYRDDLAILQDLKANNAGNLSLLLKGWQKGGLDAPVSDKIRVSSALGGKKELQNLAAYCKQENIGLSLSGDISFVGADKTFDSFKPKRDAARTLELQYARNATLSPDTMQYDDGKYVVKPSAYDRYLTGLTKQAGKYAIENFNLGALGSALNADYTKNASINRAQSLRYIKETLEKSVKKTKLSFEKGNAYVLPYATAVSGVSTGNSGLPGETAAVPFLQMVLGTRVSYSSEAINLADNTKDALLACIEGGTTPTFLLSAKNTSKLKNTAYTAYYSIDYEILKKTILESYDYVNRVFTATEGTAVERHEIIADGVTVSTYGNGVKVYVNKTDRDYKADGVNVPAKDYTIGE